MTFNVHNPRAETINMVAGDQTFISGPGAQVVLIEDARRELDHVRQQLYQLDLHPRMLAAAEQEIDSMGEELASSQPNKSALAGRLRRLTTLLQGAGALAAAGQALITPLESLAHWLGMPF
jgi:hypothetical protein